MGNILGNLTNAQVALPGGGAMTAPQAQNSIPSMPDPTSGLDAQPKSTPSTANTPSFLQAMHTGPGGTPNALSPELTTKGKILTTLLSGAFGALAGAGQKTVGEGFQQGSQLPFLQAQQRQQTQSGALDLQQKQLQNQYYPQILAQNFRKTNAEINKNEGEGAKASAEAGAIPAKTALEAAQAEAANYKDDPNMGLIDLRTKQPVNPSGFAPLTADEAQVLGKQPGERVPLKVKNTASEITSRGRTTVNTEEGVFDYNRLTGDKKKLGNNPRMVFAPENRIIQTADPNKPGETKFTKAGDAVKSGVAGPQSASVQVPRKAELAEVPTNIGNQKVAFTTMIQHAELLRDAAKALHNGDVQTLAGLKNAFKNEFGYSGPITAKAIADAYGGEVTSVVAKGHMTDKEIEKTGKTIDPEKQNYETLDSVLSAYQALAKSKMNMLDQQKQSAINQSQGKGNGAASDPLGLR